MADKMATVYQLAFVDTLPYLSHLLTVCLQISYKDYF